MQTYQIRYGLLDSAAISDDVIVKNPQYGKPIGQWGSRPVKPPPDKVNRLNSENGFYARLEASILKEGFRNPIFCNAYDFGTFCRYGTSRLWIAKKHKLEVPVIIADYAGIWDGLERLYTESDILNKFMDAPEILELNDDEMRFDRCPHAHLKD